MKFLAKLFRGWFERKAERCDHCLCTREVAVYFSPYGGPCKECASCLANRLNSILPKWVQGLDFFENAYWQRPGGAQDDLYKPPRSEMMYDVLTRIGRDRAEWTIEHPGCCIQPVRPWSNPPKED